MRIFVTGTRGIPNIPGGVEKHCQELYPLIAAMGHQVTVATRTPYVKEHAASWQGIQLAHLYAPHKKSLEAIVHTFLAVLAAKKNQADLIHIHGVGPGLLAPFARLLGLKVVVTNHGPDYDRQTWGLPAKTILRMGEYLGGKFANQIIVISSVIAEIIRKRCGRESNLIYNGVPLPDRSKFTSYLDRKGIKPKNYILAVARFVPEKGLHDLIKAFADLEGHYQLVIAGDADHATNYSRQLKELAATDERIILTGFITGEDLNQVYTNARLFCLPSYHEGLPIALLEAMSYGLPVLVSDIAANREVDLPAERFFKCGDPKDLHQKLHKLIDLELKEEEQQLLRAAILEKYNWQKIARQTVAVYGNILNGR
jgi:glycosyltransferase involved in cell wall biosynthesis